MQTPNKVQRQVRQNKLATCQRPELVFDRRRRRCWHRAAVGLALLAEGTDLQACRSVLDCQYTC